MVTSNSQNVIADDQGIRSHILSLTIGHQYSHAEYANDGVTIKLCRERVEQLLPMRELVLAARCASDKYASEIALAAYAEKYSTNFMQVLFYAASGMDLDIILVAIIGVDLEELSQGSPVEAGWYQRAYRIGVARGMLDASTSMASKAGQGDLPSQRLFLEKTGYLSGSGTGTMPEYTPTMAPIAADVAASLDRVFDDRF